MTTERFEVGPFVGRPHIRMGSFSGSWQLDVPARHSSTRKRQRLSYSTRDEAYAAATLRNRRIAIERGTGAHRISAGKTFEDAADEWFAEQEMLAAAGVKREATVDTNSYQLSALLAFFRSIDLEDVTTAKAIEYQVYRRALGKKPSTVNSEIARLKQIMTWASDKGYCSRVPKPRSVFDPRPLLELPTREEVATIVASAPVGDALLLRLFAETGCRKSELFNLRWADVDAVRNLVHIRPAGTHTIKTQGSIRSFPIHRASMRALTKARGRRKADSLVFPSKVGRVRHDMRKALKAAVLASGVRRGDKPIQLSLKTLRSCYATWQLEDGVLEAVVQRRIGHTRGSKVLQRNYAHIPRHRDLDGVLRLPAVKSRKRAKS